MSFHLTKYQVIKKAISYDLANFIFNYFLLKKDAVKFMYQNNIIPEHSLFGTWKDSQVLNVYSHYADFAMETLLMKVMPVMVKETNLNLIPTYSYARIYEKGSMLARHKDRPSCEISTTLNLGGDTWPIFIDPTGTNNVIGTKNTEKGELTIIKEGAHPGIKVDLEPGDMLVYSGCELEHWREEFTGNVCGQVFLHYNHVNGQFANSNLYDKRPLLGLPSFTKK